MLMRPRRPLQRVEDGRYRAGGGLARDAPVLPRLWPFVREKQISLVLRILYGFDEGAGSRGRRKGAHGFMEVFVQQLINGLTLGSIYGLIAIGYTMVYGIIGM